MLSAGALLWSGTAAAEQAPWLQVGGAIGMTAQTPPSSEMEIHGAAGLQVLLRRVREKTVLFAEGTALPGWSSDLYSARAGLVWGWSSRSSYTEYQGSEGVVYQGGKAYQKLRFKVDTSRQLKSVSGLHLGAGFHHAPSGNSPVLEVGFGHVGQNAVTFAAVMDPIRLHPGMRFDFLYTLGDKSFSVAGGMQFQALFNFKEQPLPLTLLFVLQFGSGFGKS